MALPKFDPDFATWPQWAAMYRAVGWQVIPAYAPGEDAAWKRPKLSQWTHYQNELVPDATFMRWYDAIAGEHRLRRNMGLLSGKASKNTFVIDLDLHKNPAAMQWWNSILEVHNNGLDLETVEQITGGGGLQKLFEAPEGWHAPTNRTPKGVDIRGQGGFAMLPPSWHESGHAYDWAPGKAPWEVDVLKAPQWLLDEVRKLVEAHGGHQGDNGPKARTASPGGDFDPWGQRHDGREDYMTRVVWAAVVDWHRECPIAPPAGQWAERCRQAYEAYERNVISRETGTKQEGLEREGRGPSAFWVKFQAAMKHWDTKVAADAAVPNPNAQPEDPAAEFNEGADKAEAKAKANPSTQIETLDIPQIKNMPDPKWLVEGVIVEQALGFIYGPPGAVKTFIALDLGLSFATGRKEWWGRNIQRGGTVIYISAEGISDLKFRIMAWEKHHGVNADASPFRLIRQGLNFTSNDDIGKLLATVQAVVGITNQPVAAVIVDTVSRVLPGVDENLQKDMTIFVHACDLVRQKFGATVIGIHHTARAGNMRGSTVIPAAGDFILECRREPGASVGSIFAVKIKADEDGWEQHFRIITVTLDDLVRNTSLVVQPTDPMRPQTGEDRWPHKDVLRQILKAIEEEWDAGKPWCWSKNSPRCAATNIAIRWHLERKLVEEILLHWIANKVIAEEDKDRKNHVKGYRKLLEI